MESRRWWILPESPLLLKELTELAAQRKTYIFRTVYAALLFLFGLIVLQSSGAIGGGQGGGTVGRDLFASLVTLQEVAILMLVPGMTASALTVEKERETLSLLLLTTISPWKIVMQKYLGRVVLILSYLVLSFPLMAVAYSFGGITTVDLWGACVILVMSVLYQAAFSMMCASFFRTSLEAIFATYILQIPVTLMAYGLVPGLGLMFGTGRVQNPSFLMFYVFVGLIMTAGCLLMATETLHSRAFIPARNVMLQLFKALDRFFNDWNQVSGGVILVRDGSPLPLNQPVAWRETSKKSLGTFRYLIRVLMVIELPILFVSQVVNLEMVRGHTAMRWLLYMVWGAAVALITLHAGGLVASERSRQTLDVLLSTPMSGPDIVRQKMAGVRRLVMVLSVPFITIIGFEHWFRDYGLGWSADHGWNGWYLLQSGLVVICLVWFVSWLAGMVGLRVKHMLTALFVTTGIVSMLCVVPILLSLLVAGYAKVGVPGMNELLQVLAFNPATMIAMVEEIPATQMRRAWGLTEQVYPYAFGAAVTFYLLAGFAIRWYCLKNSDRLLGRATGLETAEDPDAASEVTPGSQPASLAVQGGTA